MHVPYVCGRHFHRHHGVLHAVLREMMKHGWQAYAPYAAANFALNNFCAQQRQCTQQSHAAGFCRGHLVGLDHWEGSPPSRAATLERAVPGYPSFATLHPSRREAYIWVQLFLKKHRRVHTTCIGKYELLGLLGLPPALPRYLDKAQSSFKAEAPNSLTVAQSGLIFCFGQATIDVNLADGATTASPG